MRMPASANMFLVSSNILKVPVKQPAERNSWKQCFLWTHLVATCRPPSYVQPKVTVSLLVFYYSDLVDLPLFFFFVFMKLKNIGEDSSSVGYFSEA
uniref:Uncharacterized protein n=1 Tax=Kalanchoe fedtschenkoi TaxID=63787 RepID=A0A7N0UEI0_KALFE